ncbi:Protein MAIN-LIKE 2, partial [Linum perenne]
DASLLWGENKHRAELVWRSPAECKALKLSQRSSSLHWSPQYDPFLEQCWLKGVCRVLGHTPCKELVTALLERWRPETNTFHLVPGEATITLEDVEVLTALRTTGLPVVVGLDDRSTNDICAQWSGVAPPPRAITGTTVKVSWVKGLFDHLPANTAPEVVTFYARAYTWVLVASVLLADRSGDHIPVHILPLVGDPVVAPTYSWGSAVLAWLYKWEQRDQHIATGELASDDFRHHFHDEYDEWYRRQTRMAISHAGAQFQMMVRDLF